MVNAARFTTRGAVIAVAVATALSLTVVPDAATAHPGDDHRPTGLGVEILPIDDGATLAGFLEAVQWAGTAKVDDQRAVLVYAGTGCTPAHYAAVDAAGKIVLVDSRVSATNPADQCPVATFFQKVRSAQAAGAIGFVQIPDEGEEPTANATAVAADIPALEVHRTDKALDVRDAVIRGRAIHAALRNIRIPLEALSDVACVKGKAGPFACHGIDLLSFVPHESFNSAGISDLWGWTDRENNGEYVIIGKTNGVAFFRVTNPIAPQYLGELPNPGLTQEVWHDIKVYKNHAFIVSESEGHGMTVFDLTRLRRVKRAPGQPWDPDAVYPLTSGAHNLEINTETGYAYIVGGNAGSVVPDHCLSGLHMVDIRQPKEPAFAGCYLLEGGPGTAARSVGSPMTDVSPAAYVHDTQCVIYRGPDKQHRGKEICFNSAEDKVVIVDVTDKGNPVTLGMTAYDYVAYTHQGWLSKDQRFLFVNDELDEATYKEVVKTRTVVLDVRDLDKPKPHVYYSHPTTEAITHNNYVVGNRLYQSNYAAGLRVVDVRAVHARKMREVAFFDTFPDHDDTTFDGTWSNYPFFASGTIAVSGRQEGLFLLRLATDRGGSARRGAVTAGVVKPRSGDSRAATTVAAETGEQPASPTSPPVGDTPGEQPAPSPGHQDTAVLASAERVPAAPTAAAAGALTLATALLAAYTLRRRPTR